MRTLLTRAAILAISLASILPRASASPATADDDASELSPLVIMEDFNRDGIPDIARIDPAASPAGPRALTILLGHADGSYQPSATNPAIGRDPQAIAGGDFNRDGIPDLIIGDSDGSLLEFSGDGHGNFLSATTIAHLGSVVSIAVGDFNRDGILDLAVSDLGGNSVAILLGTGTGSFRQAWSFSLPKAGTTYRLATADFNGDGIPDLAVTNQDQDSFEVLTGNGNGTFTDDLALSRIVDPNTHCAT